jgi:hypothetical protein
VLDPGVLLMNHTTNPPRRPGALRVARRLTLPWFLWVFGLSTTLLLVGLWGRAVTVDQETIARSTEAALSADLVTERVWDWVGDGLAATDGVGSDEADRALDEVRRRPEAAAAVEGLIDEVVAALVAPPGADAAIDVSGALAPLVPEVVSQLAAQGIDVPAEAVETTVEQLDPVALDAGEAVPVGVVTDQAKGLLTLGVLGAAGTLLLFGMLAVAISEERWYMVRNLATRVAFSAVSVAALFRFGGWLLDPSGGASPLRRSSAILVGSNLHVFLIVFGVTAALAAAIWVMRQTPPTRLGIRVPQERVDDDTSTQELISV